jgi:hypothetical protein
MRVQSIMHTPLGTVARRWALALLVVGALLLAVLFWTILARHRSRRSASSDLSDNSQGETAFSPRTREERLELAGHQVSPPPTRPTPRLQTAEAASRKPTLRADSPEAKTALINGAKNLREILARDAPTPVHQPIGITRAQTLSEVLRGDAPVPLRQPVGAKQVQDLEAVRRVSPSRGEFVPRQGVQ